MTYYNLASSVQLLKLMLMIDFTEASENKVVKFKQTKLWMFGVHLISFTVESTRVQKLPPF